MFHPLLRLFFSKYFPFIFGNLYHKKSNSQRYQRIKMAYKWGRSMTSCNIKELPLLPPTANTNTNINDWQDTSSNISLSEYRERLLRRNMIDDPNDDYSTDVMPLPPMLQTTTYSLLSEDLTTLTTLRPPEIDNENDHLKAPFCEPLHSTNMSIQSPIPSIHSNEEEDFCRTQT